MNIISDPKIQYQNWHDEKYRIHTEKSRRLFRERDVWFAACGKNIGQEQNGKGEHFLRPVLVIKKLTKKLFFGIPLTTKSKKGDFYYQLEPSFDKKLRWASLHQLRMYDSKRLHYFLGRVFDQDFISIRKHLQKFFQLKITPPGRNQEEGAAQGSNNMLRS